MTIVKWATFFIVRVLLVASEIMLYFCRFFGKYMTKFFQVHFYNGIFMYNFGVASPYLQIWKKKNCKMSTVNG